MSPFIALVAWFICVSVLLFFDPAREPKTSPALWAPVVWIFILGSRLPSQWISGQMGQEAGSLEEGDPLNRAILFGLILLAIGVLIARSFRLGAFFTRNRALTVYLVFALASVLWSDFPFVALKRWFRDFGDFLMIFVILSDRRPLQAFRTVYRRLGYLLVPLSILLIKYYVQNGRHYNGWTGAVEYVGAATSKNTLGVLCLLCGLFFFWDILSRWPARRESRTMQIIIVDAAFMAMTVWLLHLSSSATSSACLALGCLVILAVHRKKMPRYARLLKTLIPATFVSYLILAFGLGMMGDFAKAMGRDPTLTDRTMIWSVVLSVKINPLIGTGYESFWLGSRLDQIWAQWPGINEAHNGYLAVYLNLGLIGLFLISAFLVASYGNIWKGLNRASSLSAFTLGVWTVSLFYNMTEAALGTGLLWLALLPGALAPTEPAEDEVQVSAPDEAAATPGVTVLPFEAPGWRE